MNFAKPLRTPFLTEHLWWLLLSYKLGKANKRPFIVNLVQGYQIQFSSKRIQNYVSRMAQMNLEEEVLLVDQQNQEMLRKEAI